MHPVRTPTALDGTLQDETGVQLRPLRPEDSEHLQRGLMLMSPASRHARFGTPVLCRHDRA